jgi:hypothetical protein
MARVGGPAVLVSAALLAGCGGHASPPAKTTATHTTASAVCRSLALALVDDAHGLLQAYGGNPSPGDLAMYDLREHVAYAQSNRCAPATVGAALAAGLSPHRFAALIAHLPTTYARDLEQARACAAGSKPAESCVAPVEPVSLPGATKPGGTPHPLVP